MSSKSEKSSEKILQELSDRIKSKSESHILSTLTKIKTDPQVSKDLVKNDRLEDLISLLVNNINLGIQNACLSILANVCMHSEARYQIRKSKLAHETLLLILNNLKFPDNLHCRSCRLIANLSECSWHAKKFFDIGAIPVLKDILQARRSTQMHLTAIRAIRNIWSNHSDSQEKILDLRIIATIMKIFIYSNNSKRSGDKKYIELSETCLKAFNVFLANLHYRCAEQMIGKSNDGYKVLLELCGKKNKLAIKCIYNLSQIAEIRPLLGNSDAVEIVIMFIESNNFSKANLEFVVVLCLLCREAVNRLRIRDNFGIQLILELLKNKDYENHHHLLLEALGQFVYDDSIPMEAKTTLIDILTDKLKNMLLHAPKESTDKKPPVKRPNESSPSGRMDGIKYNRTNSGRYSSDYYREDWSPCSSNSVCSTPPGSPPYSLFGDLDGTVENEEENYSPVCSDTEDVEDERQEEVESLKSFSSANVESEDGRESKIVSKSAVNEHISIWTLALLSKLSYSDDPIDKLADSMIIEPLTDFIRYTKNAKASRILTRIVSNKAYLLTLVKQGFVFRVQNLDDYEQYAKHLCESAQTGGVIGELTTVLLKGQESDKYVTAVSIPFIIKCKKLLFYLLNTHGGLELIFQLLKDKDHSFYDKAVLSICELAESLKVRADMEKNQSLDHCIGFFNNVVETHPKPTTVTFELDDGSTVDVCRKMLCRKSDAFSAMLEGHFSESGKRRVKLKNTTKEALSAMLLAANGSDFDDHEIESLLDAVLLADKFLMPDVSELLTESLLLKLNHENYSRAWSWARKNLCQELKVCCVKSFLTTKMSKIQRLRAFQDFSINENFHEFLDEIKVIINGVLSER